MKKSAALFLIITVIALVLLTGCGSDTVPEVTQQVNTAVASPETVPEPSDEPTLKPDLGYRQVDAETAKGIMDSETGYIILDVRTPEEFSERHIPDAILIPDYELADRAGSELDDKNQLILVYCRSGNRSKRASAALVEMGYTNVVEFGGINSWPYEVVE